MKKTTYEYGVHETNAEACQFVVCFPVRRHAGRHWGDRKLIMKWLRNNAPKGSYLTPSHNFRNEAGEEIWMVRVETFTLATALYLVFGEGFGG